MGGSTFEVKIHQLTVKFFLKKICIPFLIDERQPNQVQAQFFGDSNLFHHYLIQVYYIHLSCCQLLLFFFEEESMVGAKSENSNI